MTFCRRRWFVAVSALPLAALGCREELGPERMPTVRARGRVHIRGAAVGKGWIEFHPLDGTVGVLHSARLSPDGSFDAHAVPLGQSAIQLAPVGYLPPAFRDFERAALIRRTVSTQDAQLDIDLQDELLRLLRERATL